MSLVRVVLSVLALVIVADTCALGRPLMVPVPVDSAGLKLLRVSVHAEVASVTPSFSTLDHRLTFRRENGPVDRAFTLAIERSTLCERFLVVFHGDTIPITHVVTSDTTTAAGFQPGEERWQWTLSLPEGDHDLLVSIGCAVVEFACTDFEARLWLDLGLLSRWGEVPPFEYTVHFDPIVGRESLYPWTDGALYDQGTLSWTIDARSLPSEMVVEWANGGAPAVLTDRHVIGHDDLPSEHYPYELGEDCTEEPEADSLWMAGTAGIPDTLTPTMRAWVTSNHEVVVAMVSGLTALRDSLADRAGNPAHRRDSPAEEVLNPIARRNLALGRLLIPAFDVSHPPSRIARDVDAAFRAVDGSR